MTLEIPLSKPLLTAIDTKSVVEAMESGWLTQAGSAVSKMESTLSNYISGRSLINGIATTTSNGTTALHLSLLSLGIGVDDEVIVPDFSYIAVVNSVLYCGATPVVVDIGAGSWNIDPIRIANAVTPRTKAVICVDNYGILADYSKIREVLPNNISIIQDASESFPSFDSSDAKVFQGDIVTLSFYANKVFTSGEGGAVFSNEDIIGKIKTLKNQGLSKSGNFSHKEIGFNYRLSNIHAAIFNAQWEQRDIIHNLRKMIFSNYQEQMVPFQEVVQTNAEFHANNWLFTIEINDEMSDIEEIRNNLRTSGIETRPGFLPFSLHSHLQNRIIVPSTCEYSEKLSKQIISLPTFPELRNDEIKYIAAQLRNSLNARS
jgi:perosamine synthetase